MSTYLTAEQGCRLRAVPLGTLNESHRRDRGPGGAKVGRFRWQQADVDRWVDGQARSDVQPRTRAREEAF